MTTVMTETRGLLAPGARRPYCLAGRATVTVVSGRTGQRYTYKVIKKDVVAGERDLWFVKVLTGPDNGADYEYLGTVFSDGFRVTSRSRIGADAPCAVAFTWFSKNWESDKVEVWHEGSCGRCGRRLTVPESVASGIGPTCAGYGQ